jgi:hypothetical protein
MRMIWLLAAAAGVAATGTAAPARPATAGFHNGSPQAGWSGGGGHHAGQGPFFRFRPGPGKGDRGHGRHHRRYGRDGWDGFNPYGAGGIAGPVGAVDPYGNGFFNGGGGRIRMRGGRPHFEYDRAYPYQWTSAADGREPEAHEDRSDEPSPQCTYENGVRVCRGW